MAGEKAKISQEIKIRIQELTKEKIEDTNKSIDEEFSQKIFTYNQEEEHKIESKLLALEKELQGKLVKKQKEIDWNIHQELMVKRLSLWEDFQNNIKEKIELYRNSKVYETWIENLRDTYPDAYFYMDKADEKVFLNTQHECQVMTLGGIYIEVNHKILDYTLETKMNRILEAFKNEIELKV